MRLLDVFRPPRLFDVALFAALVGTGCRGTVDSLGRNASAEGGPRRLQPVTGPSTYPNPFRDVLRMTDQDIQNKIESAFNQLFHGDTTLQTIFFPVGVDEANIQDIYHSNEIRTEGMGLAMLICVELNKQTEFNQLWRYSKAELMETSDSKRGYFKSYCDTSFDSSTPPTRCWDPFGLQQFVMALIFAHNRWGSAGAMPDAGAIDYEADTWMLFDTMRMKEAENGGIVDGVTNTFDSVTHLVYNDPTNGPTNFTRPSVEMPGYYELWSQATLDTFWSQAANSARSYWKSAANSNTGMLPIRAYFTGAPYPGWDMFGPEGYRTQLNMVLDQIWNGKEPWELTVTDQLIGFFSTFQNLQYGKSFRLDGTVIDQTQGDAALVASNGISAAISSNPNRGAFIAAVWNQAVPIGQSRYFGGLLDLAALMVLGGQFRVY